MKKKVLTLRALTTLLLTGCNTDKEPVKTSKASVGDSTGSKVSEIAPVESEGVQSGKASLNEEPTEGKTTGNPKPTEESSVSPSVDLAANWPSAVKNFRKQYLGGQLVPYINLGNNNYLDYERIEPSYNNNYDDFHLEISGTVSYSTTLGNSFQANYTADGYTVSTAGQVKTAIKNSSHLKAVLKDDDDLGVAVLKVYYDEPYNAASFTAWPSDVTTELTATFGNHAKDVPLVYLGTTGPVVDSSASSSDNKLVIIGRKWNDLILTDAKTVLNNASFDTSASTTDKVIGTKVFSDNYERTITIEKYEPYSSYRDDYPKRTIQRKEPFEPSAFTAWPQEILDVLPDHLDNHTLPLVYLGTTTPTLSYVSTNTTEFDIQGSDYDPRIRTNALSVLTAAGYSEDTDEEDASYYSDSLYRVKTETDGCKIEIEVYKTYNDLAKRIVKCAPGFGDPSTFTDWSQEVKDLFDQYCEGIYPPAVYLGKMVNKGSCYNGHVEITSPTWDDRVRSNALSVLTALGWTENFSDESSASSSFENILVRESPIDTTNYVKWKRKLYKWYGKVDCEWTRTKAYNPSDTSTAYPQDVLDDISDHLNGQAIPYVYLGTQTPTSSWSTYYSSLTITGAAWDDAILTKADAAYQAAGWEKDTDSSTGDEHDYILHNAAGYYYARVYKNSSDKPIVEIFYIDWTTETDYTADVKTEISTWSENERTLPYLYLGSDAALTTTRKGSDIVLSGNVKKSQALFYRFKKAYTTEGWTIEDTTSTSVKAKLVKDGYTFYATLDNNTRYNSSYVADITFKRIPPYNFSDQATRSYSASDLTTITTALGGNSIPTVYLGTKTPTITVGTYSTSWNQGVLIKGSLWNDKRIRDNKTVREDAGYTTIIYEEGSSYTHFIGGSYYALEGYKALGASPSDGYIRFIITRDSYSKDTANAKAVFFYDAPTAINDGSTVTSKWNESATNIALRDTYLGGTHLPYFDLGTVNRSYDKSSSSVKLVGSFPSSVSGSYQAYARNALDALKAFDPTLKRVNVDYSYDNKGRKGVYQGHAADGNLLTYSLTCTSSAVTIYIAYSEIFNPSPATDWDDAIKADRQSELGGHVLPYFSLGTKDLTEEKITNKVTLTGKTFDTQVFSLCEEALTSSTDGTWAVVHNGKDLLLAKGVYSNGTIYVKIEENNSHPVCTITFEPKAAAED